MKQVGRSVAADERRRAYDDVRDSLDEYLQWLYTARRLTDPFNRSATPLSLSSRELPGDSPEEMLRAVNVKQDLGRKLLSALSEHRHDFRGISDELLSQLSLCVGAARRNWSELYERCERSDWHAVTMVNDALEINECDATEYLRAEMIFQDLLYQLQCEYKSQVYGEQAVEQYEASQTNKRGVYITVEEGWWVFTGLIPFDNAFYREAIETPPWQK